MSEAATADGVQIRPVNDRPSEQRVIDGRLVDVEFNDDPARPPEPRGTANPRWRAPQVPSHMPRDRARVPVVQREVRPGRLERALVARVEELERGGRFQPKTMHVNVNGRPVAIHDTQFVPWTDAEADREMEQHDLFLRSLRNSGTRYLEDVNHQLADENDGIHAELEGIVDELRALRPAGKWRESGIGDIGRYSAAGYDRLLDAVVARAEALYARAAAHAARVQHLQGERQRGGYAVMHDMLDAYPVLVERMLPLQPPREMPKLRQHWHDLDTDRHESLMVKVQDLINDCEEIRARLHARDALRGKAPAVDTDAWPAFRGGQRY